MDAGDLFLEAVKTGLGAAGAVTPDAWKKTAIARLNDFNPLRSIPFDQDLRRATRLAWVEAARVVTRASKSSAEDNAIVSQVAALAECELRNVRTAAFNRDVDLAASPIDEHVKAIMSGAGEPLAPHGFDSAAQDVTHGFGMTFAAVVGWPYREMPAIFENVAQGGLTAEGGRTRTFGELVFAEFAEILKNPKRYPEAREAFHIATDHLARQIAENTFAAMRGLDAKLDAVLEREDALLTLRAGLDERLALLAPMADSVARVERKVDSLPDAVAEKLVEALERKDEARRVEQAGLERFVVLQLAKRIKDVETFAQALVELERAVEIAIKIQEEGARGSNAGEFVDEVLRRVAALSRQGLLDEAAAAAGEAVDAWEAAEQERRATALQGGLKLIDSAIEQNLLRRDAPTVAQLEARKIEMVTASDQRFAALRRVQDQYYIRGRDQGVNLDLEVAIELARSAVVRAATPDERGAANNDLGMALSTRGERASDPARLEAAVAAYTAALEECTRERVPLYWATTQNNLGAALQALGERAGDPARLEAAVAAYTAALQERTRERVPLAWAATQNNLGAALQALGERAGDPSRLEAAVAAHTAALQERTRERVPLDWAMTQNNLGAALQALGERAGDPSRLEATVAAYTAALQERTRERVPLAWAMTQNNLGAALQTLGQRGGDPSRLAAAVAAYTAALQEYTRARVPLAWAATQNNLGVALQALGERAGDPARLEAAVAAHTAALEEYTRERVPLYWAMTRANLAIAYLARFRLSGQPEDREAALVAVDDALAVYREGVNMLALQSAESLRAEILAAAPPAP